MKRQKRTILLVEDDRNDQLFIERAFRMNGVTNPLRLVANGAEAIAYLKGDGPFADRKKYEFPTMIITDLKMPVLDGFGVLEAVRNHQEWAIIPVIILSASQDPDDIKTSYRLGASSYLVKPQNHAQLQDLMRKFYDYWVECDVPQVDVEGRQLPTEGAGKLGEQYPQPAE